jgi:hypothetical protein
MLPLRTSPTAKMPGQNRKVEGSNHLFLPRNDLFNVQASASSAAILLGGRTAVNLFQ